jgi:hypothetical protein
MIALNWMTKLVTLTIGATRGRAARGSPLNAIAHYS